MDFDKEYWKAQFKLEQDRAERYLSYLKMSYQDYNDYVLRNDTPKRGWDEQKFLDYLDYLNEGLQEQEAERAEMERLWAERLATQEGK